MARLRGLNIFPIKDEDDFEQLCLALWKRILRDPNTQINGRRGQRQHGVDLFGRRDATLDWVGVQCKVRSKGIPTETQMRDDVEKAKVFNPRLSEFVFATTAPRDARMQETARRLTVANSKSGHFSVNVFFWDDIEVELSEESNLDICRHFYHDFFINYERLGIAVARVIGLSVGVGCTPDSRYELLLGKTACAEDPSSHYGTDYWKGNYFIGNWSDRRLDTFPLPVFATDLEHVFASTRDAYIIAKWLQQIGDIDDVLYGTEEEHEVVITPDEYLEFLDSRNA